MHPTKSGNFSTSAYRRCPLEVRPSTFFMMHQGAQQVKSEKRLAWNLSNGALRVPAAVFLVPFDF